MYTVLSASAFLTTLSTCSKCRWRDICQEHPKVCIFNIFPIAKRIRDSNGYRPLCWLRRRADSLTQQARGRNNARCGARARADGKFIRI